MVWTAVLFVAGLGLWTLVEYIIHGPLGHQFPTFVRSLHGVHHKDPHAVFTARAWLPLGAITLGLLAFFGLASGMFFYFGLIAGFITYEAMHYRIHFVRPHSRFETNLRLRHLAHHQLAPNSIFGVTSDFWDRVFGTEPAQPRLEEMERAVWDIPALTGPSNWKRAITLYFGSR
jgi:sterol desaturase/sphingolipid hydroxylase (fatty acid hydroxylase superfamily)